MRARSAAPGSPLNAPSSLSPTVHPVSKGQAFLKAGFAPPATRPPRTQTTANGRCCESYARDPTSMAGFSIRPKSERRSFGSQRNRPGQSVPRKTRRFGELLFAVDQHAKRPQNRLRPPICARWRKICRIHENVVCLGVETHGLGAQFCLHLFYLAELVRRVFVEDVHKTFARRDVHHPRLRLKHRRIRAPGDGE